LAFSFFSKALSGFYTISSLFFSLFRLFYFQYRKSSFVKKRKFKFNRYINFLFFKKKKFWKLNRRRIFSVIRARLKYFSRFSRPKSSVSSRLLRKYTASLLHFVDLNRFFLKFKSFFFSLNVKWKEKDKKLKLKKGFLRYGFMRFIWDDLLRKRITFRSS